MESSPLVLKEITPGAHSISQVFRRPLQVQGSDLGGISAVHLAKFGFDERTGKLRLTQTLPPEKGCRSPATDSGTPEPRCSVETWVRPAPGRRRSVQLTHRALGAASRPLPAAAAAAAAAAGAGGGQGAEPGRSGDGGGPGGGGRCGPGGGAGYPLAPALTRGRVSGVQPASLKVLRVRLRLAHNLGRRPGTLWFRVRRREEKDARTKRRSGDRRGSGMPPLFGPPPHPREAARSFSAPALPAVVMYGCESWTVKKAERRRIDAFELWCWRRL
ncbi:uncharacterized protein [Ovis canadensis]|uniref:uncharacterized protein n=1 Tax=Ovis canadensis TaxID=37174 RepID=UPI00375269CC